MISSPLIDDTGDPLNHAGSKLLKLLADDPMSTVTIQELELGKEPAYQRQRVVRDVVTLRTAYDQRRPLVPRLIGVLEGKIPHGRQRLGEGVQRYSEPELRLLRVSVLALVVGVMIRSSGWFLDEVCEQELPNRDVRLVLGQDLVGLGQFGDRRSVRFDLVHGFDVGVEVGLEGRIDWGVVDGDQGRVF